MNRRRLLVPRFLTALPLLALTLLLACGPAYRGEPIFGRLAADDPEVALGERVFYANCHQCHPGGAAGLGFGINDKPLPGWLIRLQVRKGIGAMPAFSEERIGDGELDALVAYLMALRKLERTTPPEAAAATDARP